MLTRIQFQYGGECPDCFELISKDVEHEDSCENCDHVFLDFDLIEPSFCDPLASL